uniref:Uncharacterized protein n=1 Tax=Arundo donax TaxID=35708 RepID=A0A0A9AQ84_ARUDO
MCSHFQKCGMLLLMNRYILLLVQFALQFGRPDLIGSLSL